MLPTAFRKLFSRSRAAHELEQELSAHIELQTKKYIAQGMNPEQALRRARIEFGGFEQVKEQYREVDRWRFLDVTTRNLKHTIRSLSNSPAFTLVAILILTIAIGSNLAVFSLIDGFLLRPLPVKHAAELLRVGSIDKDGRLGQLPSDILDPLRQDRALAGVCGVNTMLVPAEINGTLRSIGVAGFSGSCFETLGLELQAGRPICKQDDRIGAAGVAVITDALWHSQFGGRLDILGRPISINGDLFAIIGITDGDSGAFCWVFRKT